MLLILLQDSQRIGDPSLGIIIPGFILIISFLLTWWLYRKFSRQDTKKS
jgi:hypothetical protein